MICINLHGTLFHKYQVSWKKNINVPIYPFTLFIYHLVLYNDLGQIRPLYSHLGPSKGRELRVHKYQVPSYQKKKKNQVPFYLPLLSILFCLFEDNQSGFGTQHWRISTFIFISTTTSTYPLSPFFIIGFY